MAAEKDVEGTPVEDPDAGLEHEKEISSLRDKLEEKDAEISQLNESISNLMSSNNEALADLKKKFLKRQYFRFGKIWELKLMELCLMEIGCMLIPGGKTVTVVDCQLQRA